MAGHTERFAEFHARRNEQRAAEVKVTWRKVSEDTGGGWSGLGPNGQLVWVARYDETRPSRAFAYGDVHQTTRPWRRSTVGYRPTLAKAKAAAAELFNDAPTGAEGSTIMETTIPTGHQPTDALIEALNGSGIEAVPSPKAPTTRLRANGKTLAYADQRKAGVRLNVTLDVDALPQRFEKVMDGRSLVVTDKNLKTAAALLEWLAKQTA